jgi:hypothetical protein
VSSKNLVICDREQEYAAQLAGYLSGKKELALQVKLCNSPEQVEAIRREMAVDILLADESITFTEGALTGVSKVILLSAASTGTEGMVSRIFRYQPADDIYTHLIEALAEGGMGELWNIRKKERGKLIGIYSPVRRIGQTGFALNKGMEMAKTSNVLYINLETYAGIGGYFPEEGKRNLSMLLYYAKQESGNPGLLITTLVKRMNELDYIPPVIFPEDIRTVTVSEWMWLFGEILSHSIYDVLILDLGDCVQGLFDILKACDTIYMPAADDRLAVSKIYQYEEALCRQGYGEVWERMIRCDIRRTVKDKDIGTDGFVQRGRG